MKALQFNINVPKFVTAKILGAIFGKGVFYRGPVKTVNLADIPEPVLPSNDWVKVKTILCGFCGSDLNLIHLHDSPTASPFTSFPCIIGHEIVGEIVETGSQVNGFTVGDRVTINPGLGCKTRGITPICSCCSSGRGSNCLNFAEGDLPPGMFTGINSGVNGGFAPYFTAHKSQLFQVPHGLSAESAVMTEPVSVSLQTVFDNMPAGGERVLIIGGGVIGNLIVQSLRVLVPGCHISVIEPSAYAGEKVLDAGADELIPIKKVFIHTVRITGARVYKPLLGMDITMGGFHRVYDTVASAFTLNLSMRLMNTMGTLSIVGIGGDVKLDLTPMWLKLQTVKGVYAYGIVNYKGEKRHAFDIALEMMKLNKIKAESLVTHKFPLEDYGQMIHVNSNKGKYRALKTVVSFV